MAHVLWPTVCYYGLCRFTAERCTECYAEQQAAEYRAQVTYENAIIFVTKVLEVDRTIAHSVDFTTNLAATGQSTSTTAVDKTVVPDDYIFVTDDQVINTCVKTLTQTLPTSERVEVWCLTQHVIGHFGDGLSRQCNYKHIIMKCKI